MPAGEKTKLLWQNSEYRERMSNAHKGKKYPKHSKSMIGNTNAFKNRTIEILCPVCKKNFKSFISWNKKYCSKKCWYNSDEFKKLAKQMIGNSFRKGIKPSPIVLKNLCRKNGKDHFNWKGGITPLTKKIRNSEKSFEWRTKIFERDNYICRKCGAKNGNGKTVYFEAHHLKEFYLIVEENKIKTFKQGMDCEELWNIDNGITLCLKCHNKTKYGKYTKIQSRK